MQEFGKCGEPWMLAGNYCALTCGACGKETPATEAARAQASATAQAAATGKPAPVQSPAILKELSGADAVRVVSAGRNVVMDPMAQVRYPLCIAQLVPMCR